MISPPIAFTSDEYSRSGSIRMMSSSLASIWLTISRLAVKDLPEPDTPRMKEFPFSNNFRLAIIIFLLITFWP